MKKIISLSLFLSLVFSMNLFAKQTLIYAGELLTVAGKKPLKNQSVLIENDKVLWVKPGFVDVKDADVINLKNSFVMAGLMDMHVHLSGELGPNNDSESLKMSDQLKSMRSVHYGMQTLLAGFTTVRDVGSNPQYLYALRDAIEQGWVDGPRIIAAGGVGITGGHGDVSGLSPDLMEYYASKQVCDGPYDCRRAARRAIKFGGDWIKVAATGGVLTDRATGTGQQMHSDELTEIVEAAKTMGKKVAAHAHHEDGIIAALNAGVASIEHGSYTGKKAIKLFKQTGAYLVPTLLAGDTVVNLAKNSNFMSDAIKAKAIKVGSDMAGNFAKAYKAGVKIAFGTDSGVSKHGTNAQEAVLMHKAGMTKMDVLKSATVNAADLLGMTASLGTIEAGKQADIIAMSESPLANINALLDINFVMKSGKVYTRSPSR